MGTENTQNQSDTGVGTATATERVTDETERKPYAIENEAGELQFGHWKQPPPGTVITSRERLLEMSANYTKGELVEKLAEMLGY